MLVDAGLINVDEMNRGAAQVLAKLIVQKPDESPSRSMPAVAISLKI